MKSIVTTAVLLASCTSAARAQAPRVHPMPAGGELVRVTRETGVEATGRLQAMGGDTLLLIASGSDSTVMAVVSRERVEVRRSHREAWSGRGALAGVALGVVASLFQSGGSPADGNTKSAEVAVVGGAAGAVVGGFLGFVLAPHRWQPLRAVSASPTRPIPIPPPATPNAVDTVPPSADSSAAPPRVTAPPPADSVTMTPPLSPPAQAGSSAAPVTAPPSAPPLPSAPPPGIGAPPSAPPLPSAPPPGIGAPPSAPPRSPHRR